MSEKDSTKTKKVNVLDKSAAAFYDEKKTKRAKK